MADRVTENLQALLPALLEHVKRDVFSIQEVRAAMQERRTQEFHLLKDKLHPSDFMRMVEFEYEQERVRRQRMAELALLPKASDGMIRKRITQIWARCTFKYKYRIDLWKQFLAFCYASRNKPLFQRIVSRAIRFNPSCLQLWLMSVYHTLEAGKNPLKARRIFALGLERNPDSISFWKEFLVFQQLNVQEQPLQEQQNEDQPLMLKFDQDEGVKLISQDSSVPGFVQSLKRILPYLQ